MAFNLATFKTRALSSVVFVIIMLTGLLINEWTFFALFSVIHFGCWTEFEKLIFKIDKNHKKINNFPKLAVMLCGWAFMWWMTDFSFVKTATGFHEIAFWMMLFFLLVTIISQLFIGMKNLGYALSGLIYISLSWGLMMAMRTEGNNVLRGDTGRIIPVILIVSIWINDTMAYMVGSLIGKTPFSKISPKKTWEGTIGGAVLAVAAVTLAGYYGFGFNDITTLIVISSIAAAAGTMGDLFESKLKRMADVKDSGNMMPGHGGVLDRFDSLIFATPFAYLYVHFFM